MAIKNLEAQLEQLRALGTARERVSSSARSAGTIVLKGTKLHDFTNWDIFNLAYDHAFKRAAQSTIETQGLSSSSARLVSGSSKLHDICEQRLAKFFAFEDALLFSSRNQAVLALITSLCSQGDLVLYDEQMAGPVADAAYLSEVSNISFDINNLSSLEAELQKSQFYQNRFIFVEGLSSSTGKAANVDPVIALAAKYQALVFFDESFAVGMRGIRGSGVSEVQRLSHEVAGIYSDLSLGIASYGACVVAPQVVIDLTLNRSRTFSNEAAYPSHMAASVIAAIDHIELQHSNREKVRRMTEMLTTALVDMGLSVINDNDGPLVVIPTESARLAFSIQEALFQKGFMVEATLPRKLRSESGSIKVILQQSHTERVVEELIKAFAAIKAHVGLV